MVAAKIDHFRSRGLVGVAIVSALALAPSVGTLFFNGGETAETLLQNVAFSIALWAFWLAAWGNLNWACWAATPFLCVTPAALLLLTEFHTTINATVVGALLETNLGETRQFLNDHWLSVCVGYGSFALLLGTALRLMHGHPVRWRSNWRVVPLIGVPALFGSLHLAYAPLELAGRGLQRPDDPFRTYTWPLEVDGIRTSSPFGVALHLADALEGQRLIAARARALRDFRFGARQVAMPDERQVFVLIIGESARADRWSINGYGRPTSPRLAGERNLASFRDLVAPVSGTRFAVPLLLTRKPAAQALNMRFAEPSLVSAFREAGFVTYWFSNQAPVGAFDATYAVYAKEADHTVYYNNTGGWVSAPLDGVLLDPFKRALANANEPRQLFVLHTLGSHLDYRERYPEAFDVFTPSSRHGRASVRDDRAFKRGLNNAYDNSILYTDYLIDAVLAAVRASNRPLAAVLYVSDHGEDLYDDGCDNWAHGKPTIASLRVPMFFWYSDALAAAFPGKVSALHAHVASPLTPEVVFPTLLDAAAIALPGDDGRRSLLSAQFVATSPRVYFRNDRPGDFDRAHLDRECQLVN